MPKTAHYSPFTTSRPAARLYHSTASVWLSVDPLSDKYPNLSPYTYCANNPVRLVDPDGREIGDYFNIDGKYLGTDGKKDDKVYIVTKYTSIDYILSERKARRTVNSDNVQIALTTTYESLDYAEKTFSETDDNGGIREVAYAKGGEGWKRCESDSHPVNTPYPGGGEICIHSHTYGLFSDSDGKSTYYSPRVPSKFDRYSFPLFNQNIIVGQDRSMNKDKPIDIISFYNQNYDAQNFDMTRQAVKEILNHKNK